MDIRKIAVLGSGRLGRGIAENAASAGFDVVLFSQGTDTKDVPQKVENSLDKKLAKWAITESEKRVILGRIAYSTDLKDLGGVDLVIEATIDNFYTKQELLRTADYLCEPNVIFISTTAVFTISELARGITRPELLVGMHFIPPVPSVPVVELSRGFETADTTVETALRFAEQLGKTALSIAESPGLIHPRALLTLVNEAAYMLDEGAADTAQVETILKDSWGMSQGPLEMADRMGLDNILHWMEQLQERLGDRYAPCPLIRRFVRQNRLGVKSGRGFFAYNTEGVFEKPVEQEGQA